MLWLTSLLNQVSKVRIELLKNGVVIGVILATEEFAEMVYPGNWRLALDEPNTTPPSEPSTPLVDRQHLAWELIKKERDRRKYLGVKVDSHWFHSDDPSRIQQIALAMLGDSIPAGIQWKTLTKTPPPVFVPMTPALANGIFIGTILSDSAIFTASEVHRVAMESSLSPENYDISTGWPLSIED